MAGREGERRGTGRGPELVSWFEAWRKHLYGGELRAAGVLGGGIEGVFVRKSSSIDAVISELTEEQGPR